MSYIVTFLQIDTIHNYHIYNQEIFYAGHQKPVCGDQRKIKMPRFQNKCLSDGTSMPKQAYLDDCEINLQGQLCHQIHIQYEQVS
jgi:hypothetical protein